MGNEEFVKRWKEENKANKKNAVEQLEKLIKYKGRIENMKEEMENEWL